MKYIITDPCYVMDTKQYDDICNNDNCEFENQEFPLNSILRDTKNVPIIFHTIQGTPNGDGSCEYNGLQIGVDSGMLCIMEIKLKDWPRSRKWFGASFDTLQEAQNAFPGIIKQF